MLALLRKLRGPSLVASRKFDDKAWNLLHSHIETSVQALGFRLRSNVDSNESHDAANEHSEVAFEGTVVQPNTTFSSASSATGQKYGFAGLAVRKSSSVSSSMIHTAGRQSNGVLTAKAGLRMGLDSHPKATGSAQEECQPPTETSLNHTRDAHNTGHTRAEAVADRDILEQRGDSDAIQAGDSLLQNSKFGNFSAQASPNPVDNTSLSIPTRDTSHSATTFSCPVTLKIGLKHQKGVQAVSRPSIGANQQSNIPAPEVFLDGDSTEEAESQEEYGAKLEDSKEPRMGANSEDMKIVRAENNEDTRKQCDDPYKNMNSSDISLIFGNRRKGHRDQKEKTRKHEARAQTPRGQHPYCSHRTVASRPRDYRSTIRSLPCKCGVPHDILGAKEWKSSPAEDGWDSSLRKGDNHVHEPRRVTFAEPNVTEIRAFEEWWEDEYGLSDRYHSRGPFLHRSKDLSTKADDDEQIRKMGNLAQQLSCNLGLAASNAVANYSDMMNSPAKTTSSRLIAMAAESHRVQKSPSKREKRQGEKQTNRMTEQNATSPSIKAKVCSTTHVKFAADRLPSSDLNVVKSAPEHQAGVVCDRHSGEVISAPGKSESESAGGTAGNPASTDSQPETSSTVTSTPSQQDLDGLGDGYSYQTGLRPHRAFRDRCDSRNLRSPGPQYGGRTRWSPYQLTGIRRRHRSHGKKSESVRLMNDAIVCAALQQELAFQADEANEVPIIEELPINEAVAKAALEQELSLQADVAREVPTMEKLSLHNAAGEAKIKEWWDSLYRSHASRVALAFSSEILTKTENSETAYYDYYDTLMSDPGEDAGLSGSNEDAEMSDPEEDAEMSDA